MPEYSNLQDTAYYVFDTRVFRQRIRHVRQLLGPEMTLAYAIKANPFLTGFALGAAEKLEVCSPGECRICDALGIPAEATVISGLNKPPAFLEALISASDGRTYTVESLTQFATKGGLILTGSAKEKPQVAQVIAVGPGGVVDGKEVKMTVKVGDKVLTSKYSGTEVKVDGEECTIVRQSDILAVVED